MIEPKFVELKTKNGLTLPGLLYQANKTKKVAIYLHGNGGSNGLNNNPRHLALANSLNRRGISILFFNNRGAHIVSQINRKLYGMAYEKIKECIYDIDGAIDFLKKLSYKEFYLIGSSTGANKICVYNFYKPENPVSKYVLLCGGDDVGIYYDLLKKTKFKKILARAKQKIKSGRGEELSPELLPSGLIFSYQSFYDIANPDGDYNIFPYHEVIKKIKLSRKPLFRHFRSIKKPTLVVYGDEDEYAWGDVKRVVNVLMAYQPEFEYEIIKGANNGFDGREVRLTKTVAVWLC